MGSDFGKIGHLILSGVLLGILLLPFPSLRIAVGGLQVNIVVASVMVLLLWLLATKSQIVRLPLPIFLSLAGLGVTALMSTIIGSDGIDLANLFEVLFYILTAIILSQAVVRDRNLEFMIVGFITVGFVYGGLIAGLTFFSGSWVVDFVRYLTGREMFGTANTLAFVLEGAFLLSLGLTFQVRRPVQRRLVASAVCLITGLALVVTLSRGAWVATLFGATLVVLVVSKGVGRRTVMMGIGILAFVGIGIIVYSELGISERLRVAPSVEVASLMDAVSGRSETIHNRIAMVRASLDAMVSSPVGIGPGAFEEFLSRGDIRVDYGVTNITDHPHNSYLYAGAEYGIMGMIALLVLVAYPLAKLGRVTMDADGKEGSAVQLLVPVWAAYSLHLMTVSYINWIYFWVFYALVIAATIRAEGGPRRARLLTVSGTMVRDEN